MIYYLSGPMTGIPEWNFPEFNRVAAWLRATGHEVLNPAEHFSGDASHPRHVYMRLDVAQVLEADAVVVLPGWQRSKGAALEVAIAIEIAIPVLDARTMEPASETILEEAQRLVYGDRQSDYGHPIEDFTRTGRIWGAILGIPDVDPALVGLCMAGVKISREVNRPKRDNLTDGAGYFATVALVREKQEAA